MDTATAAPTATSLNLSKGGNISLSKLAPGMLVCALGLGWDSSKDLDAFAFCLDANGKFIENTCLYYGLASTTGAPFETLGGALKHTGDVRDGLTVQGDDETIQIDFSKVPANVAKVIIAATIFNPAVGDNFGIVKDAKIHAINATDGQEIPGSRFDLQEDYSAYNAVIFGEVYNKDGEWKFRALGEGVNGDINTIINRYQ